MSGSDAQEWIEVASHDIDTVRLLVKEKGHPDIIIYHIHQGIEKLIKAALVRSEILFEKSHRLDKLLNSALISYPEMLSIKDEILEIDYYLPKLRYPAGEKIEFETALHVYELFIRIEPFLLKCAYGE
ncbi:MAG TPA: HEPN domain-containing protein [Spirochaetota bacterium]|nr:HEPN domain-containing protein [Spirochaetota bacterium]HPJ34097.1 HEPN domain-containing protein [Spirochaetota bacterium]